MKHQLIFLGAPGAGKGTVAQRAVVEMGFEHISTGDILRREIASTSELGRRVKATLDSGALVDDETMIELLKSNCNPKESNYIFDGLPRNLNQAEGLDRDVLQDNPSRAIYFHVAQGKLLERLVNRRNCGQCGAIFNLISHPPRREDTCDGCGTSPLVHRKDDREEVVTKRMAIFDEEINPILDYYKSRGRLDEIDASQERETVFSALRSALN